MTGLDGYKMALNGRAGPAPATAAIGSFIAGTVSTLLLAMLAKPLADLALMFGPAEYFSLTAAGLVGSVVLAHGVLLRDVGIVVLGLLLGLMGINFNSSVSRFAFDVPELIDGIGFFVVAMDMSGIGEIVRNLEVLGPMMEEYLRRALLESHGDARVLFIRPISATLPGLAALAMVLIPNIRRTREEAFQEEE